VVEGLVMAVEERFGREFKSRKRQGRN